MDEKRMLLQLCDRNLSQGAADAARKRLEENPALKQSAQQRAKGGGDYRWWSIAAGLAFIAAMILYTVKLTYVSLILLALLAVFLCVIGARYLRRRARLMQVRGEISPRRCAEAFFREALGLSGDPELVSLMDKDALTAFGRDLRAKLGASARSVKVTVDVTAPENADESRASLPVCAEIELEDGTAVTADWCAAFSLASTGDCALICCRPEIALYAPARENASDAETVRCKFCGALLSKRCLAANENFCPVCGAEIPEKKEN